nr:queuosine precursor transporter [Spirochaetales bacterium]
MDQTDRKTKLILDLLHGSMLKLNTLGSKITTILGVRVSVGILFIPLLFLITDIVGEVHGRKRAQFFVQVSSGILVFMFIMIIVCIKLPANPTWGLQQQYATIFGGTLRMTIASIISFFVSQTFDVAAFDF